MSLDAANAELTRVHGTIREGLIQKIGDLKQEIQSIMTGLGNLEKLG